MVPFVGINELVYEFRWLNLLALVIPIIFNVLWRWYSKFGTIIFPYLGGQWTGSIVFQGSNGCGTREVKLRIYHTLFKIKLILESNESTSRTLSVSAYRDPEICRDRLYYVFQNERKEGTTSKEGHYRGWAVLRFETENSRLLGDYFTEQNSRGLLNLKRNKEHAWWYPIM